MILKIVPRIRVPKCGFPTPGESEVLRSSLLNSFLAKRILSVWNGYITDILIRSTSRIIKGGHPKFHLSIKAMTTVAKIVKMNFFRTLQIILQQSKEQFFS